MHNIWTAALFRRFCFSRNPTQKTKAAEKRRSPKALVPFLLAARPRHAVRITAREGAMPAKKRRLLVQRDSFIPQFDPCQLAGR
jgi:hypothetical protein